MNDLAQELVDHIIDSCWTLPDRRLTKAMESCGLVCKRWVRRTRYHLFSTVSLNSDKLESFVNLVESSPLPILSFVRHLRLRYDDRPLDTTHWARLHRCANLERIDIDIRSQSWDLDAVADWLGSDALHAHLRSWSANSGSISRLTLASDEGIVVPWRTFINIISCVPSVETLEVWDLAPSPATDAHPALFPPSITRLELGSDYKRSVSFFTCLLSLPVLPTFTSLKLDISLKDRKDWSPIVEYIERAGEGLQSLEILVWNRWEWGSRDVTYFQQRVFAHTPMLQHLTVDATSLSDLLQTLSLLPAMASLTTITVVTIELYEDFICPALDVELADPRFRTLRHFSFLDDANVLIEPLPPAMKALMPLANARGILD
ncbi:hypothetical protein DFH09DRAFT_1422303 [Mycena vulgaris]|nr:hypothetical protein DFH09DRAFT_1422303 [Mycena vulgaris]